MAAAHFNEWFEHRALSPHVAYDTLPDTERKMRREAMLPVLAVVLRAIDDEVLVDAMNAGDIEMHQAADLSQRLDEWLDN